MYGATTMEAPRRHQGRPTCAKSREAEDSRITRRRPRRPPYIVEFARHRIAAQEGKFLRRGALRAQKCYSAYTAVSEPRAMGGAGRASWFSTMRARGQRRIILWDPPAT